MDAYPNISNEMKLRYLERRKTDLVSLQEALEKNDLDAFARVGHQLKGNASTFGYKPLESIAISMEAAGQSADKMLARALLQRFKTWLADQELSGAS